jgi:hypothetical protein
MPTTVAPTPTPDPFPNALHLKDGFLFGEGEIASEGKEYRIWMNETYFWHNDMDNKYYIQKPKPGYKYLFLFINVFNKGDTHVWPLTSGNINVYYNGQKYSADPTHYLPDKLSDRKATAIEVEEIQYFSKLLVLYTLRISCIHMARSLPTSIRERAMQLIGILRLRFLPRLLLKKRMLR